MSPVADWRSWLMARPIAHRGLHTKQDGIVENSLAAAEAAITRNFAIECDVQITRDGAALVFHDYDLDRLTTGAGKVADHTAAQIATLAYKDGRGHPLLLQDFLDAIAGRVPVVIEIKSSFNGDTRLARRTTEIIARRREPLALKSFDPVLMAFLRKNRTGFGVVHVPLGMVAEADYSHKYWSFLTDEQRLDLRLFRHWHETRPDFLSWHVGDLPHVTPTLLQQLSGLPVMTWTVRTADQLTTARQWADQIIFEETSGLEIK